MITNAYILKVLSLCKQIIMFVTPLSSLLRAPSLLTISLLSISMSSLIRTLWCCYTAHFPFRLQPSCFFYDEIIKDNIMTVLAVLICQHDCNIMTTYILSDCVNLYLLSVSVALAI